MSEGSLHHVEINVSDLAQSREFWGWFLGALGYESFQEWDQGVSYRQGETYLVFVQTGKKFKEPTFNRCRTGLNHLAFHAGSKARVDEMTRELRKRGVKVLYEDRHPHAGGKDSYSVFFEDPDRIKVEYTASRRKGLEDA